MTQEIEIEYKVLLTKNEYDQLTNDFPFPKRSTLQTNYYFETNNHDLKKHRSALRIREKANKYILTLKQPYKNAILETHDPLSFDAFLRWKNGMPTHAPHVEQQLTKMDIQINELIYFGSLQTKRKTFTSKNIIYVLDESHYNGKMDYELEIEAPSHEIGNTIFLEILQRYNITPKKPITKIERFFNTLPS